MDSSTFTTEQIAHLAKLGLSPDEYNRTTAIHEAGHAVAFARLFPGMYADCVSMLQDENSKGHHSAPEMLISHETTDIEAEAHFSTMAKYNCSGWAAVMLAGYSNEIAELGCEDDFEKAGHRIGDSKEKALKILGGGTNMAAVMRIASELLERGTLSGEQVAILISVADGETSENEYSQYLQVTEHL